MSTQTNYGIKVLGSLATQTATNINRELSKLKLDPIKIKVEGLGKSKSGKGVIGDLLGNTADLSKMKEDLNGIQAEINKVGQIDVANKPIVSGMEILGHSVKDVDKTYSTFTQTLKGSDNQIVTYQGRINKLTGEMDKVGQTTKQATRDNATWMKQLSEGIKKFAIWTVVTVGYFAAIKAFKDGIKIVRDLDTALVELAKVSSITGKELETASKQAFNLGATIGRTGQEVVEATADFARMGFTVKESLNLAKDALVLVNVGDGIDDVSSATGTLIATLKGFKLEASESGRIVDVLNETSNKYAVETGDLAEGIKRTSAVMAQGNTTLEETVGLVTSATEVLQDSAKASTGIRTISQRIRGVKEALEEGEDSATFVAKLGRELKEYADVDIMDTAGQLKSTYTILTDLAGAWDGLNVNQQQFLGELVAGFTYAPYVQKCA